jgi:hypothetical protein
LWEVFDRHFTKPTRYYTGHGRFEADQDALAIIDENF